MSTLLENFGIQSVYHYAPLHYLPFIVRQKELLSKPILRQLGFLDTHFRSTSRKQDLKRGFEEYVHLTIEQYPNILRAKLSRGFPHFKISISASVIDATEYHLCRFNIAKTRYLKGGKKAPQESPENGRYYNNKRLPIAVNSEEKEALLSANNKKNMIEVLVPQRVSLAEKVSFEFFHNHDSDFAHKILEKLDINWVMSLAHDTHRYQRCTKYVTEIERFIAISLENTNWKGDGLEFDNI